jgi:hypothetical protein
LKEKGDWAGNALHDLAETTKRNDASGLGDHFFYYSIRALAEIKGVEVPGL